MKPWASTLVQCGLSHARLVVVFPPDSPDRFGSWGVRNFPVAVTEKTIGRLDVAQPETEGTPKTRFFLFKEDAGIKWA